MKGPRITSKDPRYGKECTYGHVNCMRKNAQGHLFCTQCHRESNRVWSRGTRRKRGLFRVYKLDPSYVATAEQLSLAQLFGRKLSDGVLTCYAYKDRLYVTGERLWK